MIVPAPQTTPSISIEHSAIEELSHQALVRDFAPTFEQALQLQSTQVQQSDKSKINALEQRIGNMSDFIAKKEGENQGLKAMLIEQGGEIQGLEDRLSEQSRKFARQKSELLAAHDEIIRLEARV